MRPDFSVGPYDGWPRRKNDPRYRSEAIFAMARSEGRVLLTHDRGFGRIAEQAVVRPPAILLMRLRTLSTTTRAAIVAQVLADLGGNIEGHFVVIEPMGARSRRYKD